MTENPEPVPTLEDLPLDDDPGTDEGDLPPEERPDE